MLKIHYQKLRLKCKVSLNAISNSSRIGKRILQSIPVLSIFVLLGIMTYSISPSNFKDLISLNSINSITNLVNGASSNNEVYADELIGDSTASISIAGSGKNERVTAGRDSTAYRTHKITIASDNVASYSLVISGTPTLSYKGSNATSSDNLTSASGKTGSNMDNSTWGYAWETLASSTSNGTNNDNLTYTAPTTTGTNLVSNKTINGTLASYNKLVFAARFDQDKPTGSYQASVTLALTVTPRVLTTYTVIYNGNNNTSGTAPTTQTISVYDTDSYEFTAATNNGNLARTGYTFLGWSEDPNATTATYTAGSSKVQLSSESPTKTLYAVWKQDGPSVTGFGGIRKMQDMSTNICANQSVGTSGELYDTRDETIYNVRKLADGNCWMVDNLKLNLSSVTLTSANSDVASNYTAGTATDVTTASNWSTTDSDNKAQFNMDGFGKANYKSDYGYYYSWYAATAGTGTYSMSYGEASSSICPKGWKLPKGDYSGDFQTLKWTTTWTSIDGINGRWLGASTATSGGAFFPAAGFVYSSGLSSAGSNGFYWSRTVRNSSYDVYYLNFNNNDTYPADYGNKYFGLSIRCIAYSS